MDRRPVNVGIVGMGMMGRSFAQICRQLWETRLVGVSDIIESVGQAAARQFDVPYFANPNDLIEHSEVEAVIVATPEDAHVQPVSRALALDKSVLVEKPLAHTVADSQKLVEAADASRGVLLVGHILRFTTPFAMAKQIVDEGRIGGVQYIQTRRLNGKSAQDRLRGRCSLPLFLGVHDYDFVRWIAGAEPVRVYAESQYGVLRTAGMDTEDTVFAMISFANGVLAVCEDGWILPQGHPNRSDSGFWIQGDTGRLDTELLRQGMMLATDESTAYLGTVFMPRVDGEIRGGFVDEVRHLVKCMREGRSPLVTARDGLAAVRVAEAIVESSRTHQPVELEAQQ